MTRRVALAAALAVGCARGNMPDPADAARAYAEAVERGDSGAVYGMLTSGAQRTYGREGTRALVEQNRAELRRQAAALLVPGTKVEAEARVRHADGEESVLVYENGEARVAAAGTLPGGARTPSDALAELRQALARRSYPALMRIMTSESRSTMEADLRSLLEGLEDPRALEVKVEGDAATVPVAGGHIVKLKREDGVWRVDAFE